MTEQTAVIKGVIFDWGGVFCNAAEPFSHPDLLGRLKMTPEQIEREVKDTQNQYYRGKISSEQFWHTVTSFFGINDLSHTELTAAYLASYQLYPEMFELALKLKQEYRVVLLSNLTQDMMENIIKRHEVARLFHEMIFSNIVGYLKPECEMFDLALGKLGTKPEETIFIDDSAKNVAIAATLGIKTILFTTPAECLQALRGFGLIT